MRTAYQAMEWLINEDNSVLGFSLGYDFCAEHEFGVRGIKRAFGIKTDGIPVGVEDRTITMVPSALRFETHRVSFTQNKVRTSFPTAILACDLHSQKIEDKKEFVKAYADNFKFSKSDFHTKWDGSSGFVINVRGEENIRRLKELHQAMLDLKVSIADPSIFGFSRKSLSLVMNDRLTKEMKNNVRQADLDYIKLQETFKATGIAEQVQAKGLKYFALSPAWHDEELMVWLNPYNQLQYASGWYTIEELRQWVNGKGPIVNHNELEVMIKKEYSDWSIHLLKGLNARGIKTKRHSKLVWMDDAKTQIGVIVAVSPDSEGIMESGTYPWSEMKAVIEESIAINEAKKTFVKLTEKETAN